jgi:hypothetical protein
MTASKMLENVISEHINSATTLRIPGALAKSGDEILERLAAYCGREETSRLGERLVLQVLRVVFSIGSTAADR